MIKHIVLFKFNNSSDAFLEDIAIKLENLKHEIPEIESIEAGLNQNPDEKFHLGLTVIVKDFDALKTYANHPKHLEVAKLIRESLADRACVDYNI
ncbi:Dabb family protein [Saccharicrinis sp. FJH54]|uniref:Dabb family protein n=1 Tax=Saccharicrinis sp. FJH54 TaxID=3344665 RepID=UPI0035D45BEF